MKKDKKAEKYKVRKGRKIKDKIEKSLEKKGLRECK
jgi:hypothetical protein